MASDTSILLFKLGHQSIDVCSRDQGQTILQTLNLSLQKADFTSNSFQHAVAHSERLLERWEENIIPKLSRAAVEDVIHMSEQAKVVASTQAWLFQAPFHIERIVQPFAQVPVPTSSTLPLTWKVPKDDVVFTSNSNLQNFRLGHHEKGVLDVQGC